MLLVTGRLMVIRNVSLILLAVSKLVLQCSSYYLGLVCQGDHASASLYVPAVPLVRTLGLCSPFQSPKLPGQGRKYRLNYFLVVGIV